MISQPRTQYARSGELSIACQVVVDGSERGEHVLKGVPDTWRLFAVET